MKPSFILFIGIISLILLAQISLAEVNSSNLTLKTELVNETLEITNIGNTDFKETITINLGDYSITKKKTLKPLETIKINLRSEVKPGVYNIGISPTGETFEGVVVSSIPLSYYLSYWKYVIALIVLIVIISFIYNKIKLKFRKEDEYMEIKGDKKKFIIESTKKPKFSIGKKDKEEFLMVSKGNKQKPPEQEGGGFMGMFD
jgi:hypothetical protein